MTIKVTPSEGWTTHHPSTHLPAPISTPIQKPDRDLREAITRHPRPRFQHLADPQEDLFARHCTIYPPSQAYHASGYPRSKTPAGSTASALRLLSLPRVSERYQYYMELHAHRLDIRVERLLAEQGALAFSDIADCIDPNTGDILPIHLIPPHARAAIREIKGRIVEKEHLNAEGVVTSITRQRQIDLKFHAKQPALDTLHKLTGLVDSAAHEQMAPRIEYNVDEDKS